MVSRVSPLPLVLAGDGSTLAGAELGLAEVMLGAESLVAGKIPLSQALEGFAGLVCWGQKRD